jgi:hypothetical protein
MMHFDWLSMQVRDKLRDAIMDDFMPDFIYVNADAAFESLWLDLREEFWNSYYEGRIDREAVEDLELMHKYPISTDFKSESSASTSKLVDSSKGHQAALVMDQQAAKDKQSSELRFRSNASGASPSPDVPATETSWEQFARFYRYHVYVALISYFRSEFSFRTLRSLH